MVVLELPEDVVLKILCRLPVKSLIRFTCVSKRWRSSIISDSQFARSTFQHASQTRTLRPRLLMTTPSSYSYSTLAWEPSRFECFADLDMPCFNGTSSVQSLTLPPDVENETAIASCNGLVVLAQRSLSSIKNMSLWNPSTGFFRKIPNREFSLRELGGHIRTVSSLSCGFGHVTATDEYKLVFFEPFNFVHIYSTRDRSWKVITAPPGSPFPYGKMPLLVSNGACHWVSDGVPKPAIYAFDFAEEKFRQLPLPLALMPGKVERLTPIISVRSIATQVLLGGCLCVWSQTYYGYCEFWMMKEYGVPESWVKMFHFSEVNLRHVFVSIHGWIPVFVTEGGTVLINLNDKELVRIQCHREERPVCIGQYKIKEANKSPPMVYEETLISV